MRFNVSDKSKVLLLVGSFMALGYESCGGTLGLGALQEASGVTKHNVLRLCRVSPDYRNPSTKEVYGDYVAGRMMKTGISFNENEGWVEVPDRQPTPDYQGWCSGEPRDPGVRQAWMAMGTNKGTKYASYEALLRAAAQRMGVELLAEAPATA